MSQYRFNALMVELPSYGIGVHYTTWEQIAPELHPGGGRNASDELCERFDCRQDAERHLRLHADRIRWETSPKRKRRWILQGERCWYCGERMEFDTVGEPRSAEEEHQTPQASRAPGVNDGSNIVLSCRKCNQEKGDMNVRQYRAELMRERGNGVTYLLFHGEWQRMATVRLARRSEEWKRYAGDGSPKVTRESLEASLAWVEQNGRIGLTFARDLALEIPPQIPDEWLASLLTRAPRVKKPTAKLS